MEDLLRLRMQHSSLQFSDSHDQQASDIHDLFAQGTAFPIKTGTEAGAAVGNDNRALLEQVALEHDHRIHFVRDVWVAVDRQILKAGTRFHAGGLILSEKSELKDHRIG